MGSDSSGNYTLPQAAFVGNTPATAAAMNSNLSDIAAGLTARLMRDGSGGMTANLAMGTNKVTGLGNGTAATDAAAYGQVIMRTIESQVASNSAAFDFDANLDDTYDRYELEFTNLVPQTDDVTLFLRVGTGGGPTWQSGASAYTTNAWLVGASAGQFLGGAGSAVFLTGTTTALGVGNAAGEFVSGVVEFDNPDAAKFPVFSFRSRYMTPAPASVSVTGGGSYGTSGAITGLQLSFSSGNIVSGTARLIGYRKA